jgi:hypothetical protein
MEVQAMSSLSLKASGLTITVESASEDLDAHELQSAATVALIEAAPTSFWAAEHGEDVIPPFFEGILTAIAHQYAEFLLDVGGDRPGMRVSDVLGQLIQDLRDDGRLQEPVYDEAEE